LIASKGGKNNASRGIKLNVNGREILPEHIADLWINGVNSDIFGK
jgi:hypothetical protein